MRVSDPLAPVYQALDIALNNFDASGHRSPEVSRNCLRCIQEQFEQGKTRPLVPANRAIETVPRRSRSEEARTARRVLLSMVLLNPVSAAGLGRASPSRARTFLLLPRIGPRASALLVCRRTTSRAGHRAIILRGVEVGLRAVGGGLPSAVHACGRRTCRAVAKLVALVGVYRSADVGPCCSLNTGRTGRGLSCGRASRVALCKCTRKAAEKHTQNHRDVFHRFHPWLSKPQ